MVFRCFCTLVILSLIVGFHLYLPSSSNGSFCNDFVRKSRAGLVLGCLLIGASLLRDLVSLSRARVASFVDEHFEEKKTPRRGS